MITLIKTICTHLKHDKARLDRMMLCVLVLTAITGLLTAFVGTVLFLSGAITAPIVPLTGCAVYLICFVIAKLVIGRFINV